jgi:LysM repeat protein
VPTRDADAPRDDAPPPAADAWAPPRDDLDDVRAVEPVPPPAEPRRMPVGYAPVAPSRADHRPVAGGSTRPGREPRDPAAPSWEEPRRFEAYPTLKARGSGGIPRPLMYAGIVLLVGVALFAAPFILRGFGGGGEEGGPTPTPAASVEPTATPEPTPEPTPEQIVYVVKKNDTLSKIAAQFGVTVDQVLAANPQITNANQIAVGDEIIIPPPLPDEIDGSVTPAP